MKIFLLSTLLITASVCVYARQGTKSAAKPNAATEQELIKLNQELIDALARGDRATVDRIYAEEFVRTSVQGEVLTKAQLLASLKAPEAGKTVTYESKDIKVIDYGDAAVVIYLSIRHTDAGGQKSDFLYRVTDTFVRRAGRWQKAASAGTPVLKENAALK
jgi:ketosteroid isomerase-like protein